MTFADALKQIYKGQQMTRTGWASQKKYVYLDTDTNRLRFRDGSRKPNLRSPRTVFDHLYYPLNEDIGPYVGDWEVARQTRTAD